jgi:hypothetical protein
VRAFVVFDASSTGEGLENPRRVNGPAVRRERTLHERPSSPEDERGEIQGRIPDGAVAPIDHPGETPGARYEENVAAPKVAMEEALRPRVPGVGPREWTYTRRVRRFERHRVNVGKGPTKIAGELLGTLLGHR